MLLALALVLGVPGPTLAQEQKPGNPEQRPEPTERPVDDWRTRREAALERVRRRRERWQRLEAPAFGGLTFVAAAGTLGIALRVNQIDRKLERFQDRQRLFFVHSFGGDSPAGMALAAVATAGRERELARERSDLAGLSPFLIGTAAAGGWLFWRARSGDSILDFSLGAGPRGGPVFALRLSF